METKTFHQNLRVAAIHDISGIGRCSLTVALPVLSAMGIETAVMPTAVLSTHTGEFTGYTFRDLTDDMLPMAKHWASLGLHFDAVYTGYFGNIKQLNIAEEIFDLLADKDTIRFIDPVMADNGSLYKNFDMDYVAEMKNYCKGADVILPNITEACLLTGTEYKDGVVSAKYIEELLTKLAELESASVVLTGVTLKKGHGLACLDIDTGKITYSLGSHVDGIFYGAGDLLASVLLGYYLKGESLNDAAAKALDFTHKAIIDTKNAGTPRKYGLIFEPLLKDLS